MPGEGIGDSLWQACVDQLAQELSEQQFNTWIKPLTAKVTDDLSRVTVFVANRFKLDWIRAQYAGKIASMAEKLYGQPVQLELALAQREAQPRSYSSSSAADTAASWPGYRCAHHTSARRNLSLSRDSEIVTGRFRHR